MRVWVGLAVLAMTLGVAAPAHAQLQWNLAGQTAASSFLIPVDPSWNRGTPTEKKLKVLRVSRNSPRTAPVAEENEWEFNCVARTFRITASSRYDFNGDYISNAYTPTEWAPLNEGIAGYLSGMACGDTKPIGPEYPNLDAVIDGLWSAAE